MSGRARDYARGFRAAVRLNPNYHAARENLDRALHVKSGGSSQ